MSLCSQTPQGVLVDSKRIKLLEASRGLFFSVLFMFSTPQGVLNDTKLLEASFFLFVPFVSFMFSTPQGVLDDTKSIQLLEASFFLFFPFVFTFQTPQGVLDDNRREIPFAHDLTTDADIESNPGPFVTEEGINTLKPSVWLDDSIVDFYGDYITESSELCQFFRIGNLHAAVSYGDLAH
ncbi:hypothetical protein GEMRC1_004219 [Eukaryota sp. GEM-RC1]